MNSDLLIGVVFNIEQMPSDNPYHLAWNSNEQSTDNIYTALCALGYQAVKIPLSGSFEDVTRTLAPYSRKSTFLFSNIDGFGPDVFGAANLLELIENLGFCHTGSTGQVTALCTDKGVAHAQLLEHGVPAPAFQVFHEARGDIQVSFPAIVKPLRQDASIGVNIDSVVSTPAALFRQVAFILQEMTMPALVEEFIPGRELAVSMLGNEFLAISEEDYSQIPNAHQHLITYDAKWNPQDYLYQNIILRCPAELSTVDHANITQTVRRAAQVLGLRDYARLDIRYHDQVPYILDVNEVPDFGKDAGFFNSARHSGYTYEQMVQVIINLALKREGWL